MMKNTDLMTAAEPTDLELEKIMKEVTQDAKSKASFAYKQLAEKIAAEIVAIQAKTKAKQ